MRHAKQASTAGRVLLKAQRPGQRDRMRRFLEQLGYEVWEALPGMEQPGDAEPDLEVVIIDDEDDDVRSLMTANGDGDRSPPVVVFGPARGKKWRKSALRAGAFACASLKAPTEEWIGLLAAAAQLRAAHKEIDMLRRETDLVIRGLLESFGTEAQQLQKISKEAKNIRESLKEVQARIVRAIL